MMNWKGAWDANTQYTTDDVVSYQGSSYIAITSAPAKAQPPPQDAQAWNVVAQGIFWRGVWQDTAYQSGDAASYEGSSYIAVSVVSKGAPPPPVNLSGWNLLAAQGLMGITWRGDWDSNTVYSINDGVTHGDGTYASLVDNNQNHVPTDAKYWQNITKNTSVQGMNIATILISSIAAMIALAGVIASYIMLAKNSVSDAITAAKSAADAAKQVADIAQTAATTAQTAADAAQTTANAAQQTAINAKTAADTAQQTAINAKTTADQAGQFAQQAKQTAEQAQQTGNQAKELGKQIGNDSQNGFRGMLKEIGEIKTQLNEIVAHIK